MSTELDRTCEESVLDLFKIFSWDLPQANEEGNGSVNQDGRLFGQDSDGGAPRVKSPRHYYSTHSAGCLFLSSSVC